MTAIDSARAMLDAVAARELGAELVEADALSLPLPDASHDAACLVQVLDYVADPVAALREAERIVRPGGVVLDATEWGGDTFIAHNWPYFRRDLERSGRVAALDLARFEAEIDEAAANGAFYWSVVRHAWRASVPG